MLIIDMQERLLSVIEEGARAVKEASWLGGLAQTLDVPVWLTEQYPQGLGGTSEQLAGVLKEAVCWEKVHFSACDEPGFSQSLAASQRQQIILCGAEAHICVLQTALGLLEAGYQVFWLTEATVSRHAAEVRLARARAEAAGAVAVSIDMVAYEWLERCDTDEFKQVHRQWLKARASRSSTCP